MGDVVGMATAFLHIGYKSHYRGRYSRNIFFSKSEDEVNK